MSNESIRRPIPDTRNAGKQYWLSAKDKELVLPNCVVCQQSFWPPRLYCPFCGSGRVEWVRSEGRGLVYTFTVVRQTQDSYFKSQVPYVVAIVALTEGPMLMANIVDCSSEMVCIGMPVSVIFEALNGGIGVPLFRPTVTE